MREPRANRRRSRRHAIRQGLAERLEPRRLLHGSLVFADDFNQPVGSLPDPSTWKYDTGAENGAYYADDSTTMRVVADPAATDGKAVALTLHANGSGGYSGARINTSVSPVGGAIQYGHVEARVRLPGGPGGAGDGVGCSFWMLGSNFPQVGWPACGEVDVMESSGETPNRNGGTLHGPGYQQPGVYANYDLPAGQAFYQAYHTFAADWTPGVVQFSVDGHVYAVRTRADLPSGGSWVFDHPFYIILGIGRDGGPVDAGTVLPQTEYVDYVRVYARRAVGTPGQLAADAVSTNQIDLSWQDASFDATGFTLQRSRSATFASIDASFSVAGNVGSFQDAGLTAGTQYYYRIQALSSDAASATASGWSSLASAVTWSDQDIGSGGGSAQFNNDVFTLTGGGGGGGGIGGTSDRSNFAGEADAGDGLWTAEVTSATGTGAEAGVMVRGDPTAGSAFAAVLVTRGAAVFADRPAAGAPAASASVGIGPLPVWVQLRRSADTFAAWTSADGESWEEIGAPLTVGLPAVVQGGVAVASASAAAGTATFANVGFGPPPPTPAIAVDSGGAGGGEFTADAGYAGGSPSATTAAIDTVGTADPAPPAIYQSNRYGSFGYALTGLIPGQTYDVKLSFAEEYWPAAGSRVFDVLVNGGMAIANLDMVAESGGKDRAFDKDLFTTADAGGQISLQFDTDKDHAQVNGIRVIAEPGWVTIAAGQTMTLSSSASIPGLTIEDGGTLSLAAGSGMTLTTASVQLFGSGTIDLNDNGLVVRDGNLAAVQSEIRSGYDRGNFDGSGIVSGVAAADRQHVTAIGALVNADGLGGALYTTFRGQPVAAGDVLVRYTWYGDADLDGKVDGSDYALVDAGYASHGALAGWYNGDFNGDGVVDGSDYTLIDNAFNNQRAAIPSAEVVTNPKGVRSAGRAASTGYVPPPQPAVRATTPAFSTDAIAGDLLDLLKRSRNEQPSTSRSPPLVGRHGTGHLPRQVDQE